METVLLSNSPFKQKSHLLLIVLLFVFSVGSAFAGGYYLSILLKGAGSEVDLQTEIEPSVPAEKSPPDRVEKESIQSEVEESSVFVSGQEYHNDTIMAFTSDLPRRVFVATVTRKEVPSGIDQATRVSFFDGSKWIRKGLWGKHDLMGIYTNDLLVDWTINLDPSRVLKQSVRGEMMIGGNSIIFDTGVIDNNIVVRSLPGYTKFMSTGMGSLIINGKKSSASILYTRIYSLNAKEIQFYGTPFGLTTYWLAFWDNNGNFYHIDSTDVDKPSEIYKTHRFGVKVDKQGRVSRTFQVDVFPGQNSPPESYRVDLGRPVNQTINFFIDESINKAPSNSYIWFMSKGHGSVDGVDGFGIVEYIHH